MSNEAMKKEAEKYGIPFEKHGRQLVWHDEFDKGSINWDNWSFHRTMSGKDRIYDNSEKCCRIEGDKLLLQTHRNDDPEFPVRLSEGFTTKNRMLFKYGYIEMRACIPYHHGAWPSFWTQSPTPFSKADWFSEFDIFEVFSDNQRAKSAVHKWGKNAHCSASGEQFDSGARYKFHDWENLNNEYHIYAMEWDENFVSFMVDDEVYCKVPIDAENGNFRPDVIDGVQGFHDFSYIIMNNEIFTPNGGWIVPGWSITKNDKLPFNYYIDYVRLYQNPEKEEIKLKDEILAAAEAKAKEQK